MRRRRLRFTATAREHVRLADRWWRDNSPRPQILHEDLAEAVRMLSSLPGIGSLYLDAPMPDVRRLYIARLRSHLYYTFDDQEVVIRALWHTSRGTGPEFV